MSSKTVVVAGICSSASEKVRIFIHGLYYRTQEYEKLCIFMRCTARIQEVLTVVGTQRPVVVFSGTIKACERFFVKQTNKTVPLRNFFKSVHYQLVCGRWQCWPC